MEQFLRHTQSLCPVCQHVTPAELLIRDNDKGSQDVWIRQTCEEHGTSEDVYWPDAGLFQEMDKVVGEYVWCKSFECLKGGSCDKCLDKTYNIMIEVTNRCNLDCPVCCSDANNPHSADPTVDEIIQRLPEPKRGLFGRLQRPNIVLFGGEPTVRKDLPVLIDKLVKKGYVPRIATNGVRMTDEKYLKELRDVGLKWVILQFDGFDDEVSAVVRGERLQEHKYEAIEKLTRHGFKVQLGTMMVRELNTKYAADLIEYVGKHDQLFWLSFYPHASQSRALLPTKDTSMSYMLEQIEDQTDGKIKKSDFLDSMKFLGFLYRMLGWSNLRQKHSTMPMLIIFDGDTYYPLTRLFKPLFFLKHLPMVAKIALSLPKIIFYQQAYTPSFLKILNVEKFHSDHTLDLEEASNCHMAFMSSGSYVPFDIYNIAYKKSGAWSELPEKFKKNFGKRTPVEVA